MKKDIKIKNLNSLLAEAAADTELEKLVDETEVKDKDKKAENSVEAEANEVEETPKKEDGTSANIVKASDEDIKNACERLSANPTNEEFDKICDEFKNAKIELSDEQLDKVKSYMKKEPEESKEEKADKSEVIKEDIDVEAEAAEVATDVKPIDSKEHNGVKLPEGTLEFKDTEEPKELEGHATDDEAETGAAEVATDVKPIDSKEHNGVKLPEGTLEFKDTEKPKELEGHATDDEAETGASEIGKEVEPVSSKEYNGVQLKEGFLEFKEETEISPEVKSDEIIDTLDSAADVKPIDSKEHNGVKLPEGTLEFKDTTTPNVKTDDVVETEKEADDVKPVSIANNDLDEAIEALNKEFELLHEEEHETLKSADDVKAVENTDDAKEKSPEKKEYKAVEPLEAAGFEDEEKVEKPEEHKSEYKSLKEAIALGSKHFETEEEKHALEEKMSILLASENDDLLYEEYNRLLSEAAAIKDKMIHKYSIIAHNRTNNLVESMENAEAKIIANKKSMFKKLVEQQEINVAKDSAEKLSVDETVFGK